MAILTDTSIRELLDREIVIDPFIEDNLSPVGYDFTVGEFVFSLEKGLLDPVDEVYYLPPKSTIQILTRESLWVSMKIAGTFHSKVSLVSKGLSHISTTLDPGWFGPLLITMRNNTDNSIPLRVKEQFVTLLFYQTTKPASKEHGKESYRSKILYSQTQITDQLQNQTQKYLTKINSILYNEKIKHNFKEKVELANRSMFKKIYTSLRKDNYHTFFKLLINTAMVFLIIFLITIPFTWNSIKPYFQNAEYDNKITAVVLGFISAIIMYLLQKKR